MSALIGGLLQPLAVPAHILALLVSGLLVGQQRAAFLTWAAFVAGLAAGLAAIAFAVGQTPAVDVLLAATALAGTLVALARPLPILVAMALTAAAGLALGLDSPPETISVAAGRAMLVGTWIGASLVLALVATGASYLTLWWQRLGTRIVGSWIAASAILVLALRFTRGLMFD
jgi:urease accessory protein